MYSVKFGYHFAMEMVHRNGDAGTSISHDHLGLWKKLWNLSLPNKVKNFALGTCTNSLSTRRIC